MPLFPRPSYEDELLKRLPLREVKAVTGMRRCGKSSLLTRVGHRLAQEHELPQQNLLHLDLESLAVPLSADAQWLDNTLQTAWGRADGSQPFVVMLDEVQAIPEWERVVRRWQGADGVSVYVTGSNSDLLSSDLRTKLTGRVLETHAYPLSFSEYRDFAIQAGWPEQRVPDLLDDYLVYGGMPGQFQLNRLDPDFVIPYLQDVFDTVTLNDVADRSHLEDFDLLRRIVRYVFSTSGSLVSPTKIANALTSAGRKTRQQTVDQYLAALTASLALSECPQVGLGKQLLRPKRKYYPADLGLRNLATGFSGADLGWRMECAVHNELQARGWTVRVGAFASAEIDFVAEKGVERQYIQVSASVRDEDTYKRELAPLDALSDGFPRLLITGDKARCGVTEQGVRVVQLTDWLLGGE